MYWLYDFQTVYQNNLSIMYTWKIELWKIRSNGTGEKVWTTEGSIDEDVAVKIINY